MISFEEALSIIQSISIPIESECIKLQDSLNRVIAKDIISDIDMPPFHKAAMDGFACRKADLANELEIIEEIPAGKVPVKPIGINQCSRIMTGAIVPADADFIIMKEHCKEYGPGKIARTRESANENICYKGEDVKTSDIVVTKGTLIGPQHIAILASVGIMNPLVFKMPSVAVISTGNELVEPDIFPEKSYIRNSNGYQLLSQAMQMGLKPQYMGIAPDEEIPLKEKLDFALKHYDVVLISGGVSVGDYDFVPLVLHQLGVEILFHGLTAKPGKHLLFGKKDTHFIFGMPGNPVSSFVQFEILVKSLLNKLKGSICLPLILHLPIGNDYTRKKSDVLGFIPIAITETGEAMPLEYHGSAHIHSYMNAQGIMEIPSGTNQFKKGETVRVRPL